MSSSEFRAQATTWSLDEFASFDVFTPMPAMPEMPADEIVTGISEEEFQQRLAAEAAEVEAEAYARGRADGEAAARASLDEMLAHALQALGAATQSVQLHEARWVANAEENITAIAVLVARHIVAREIATDPSFVSSLVNQSLAQYPIDQEITIRLHPEDLAACRTVIALENPHTLRWIADPTMVRGGCLTEGRERIIDGRVDTAIERAYRNIAGVQPS